MMEVYEFKIKHPENIYKEIATSLYPHREKEAASVEFIVEGTKERPFVGIRYPGRKVERREGRILWRNLFDFVVIPYIEGKETAVQDFTFKNILKDFDENKKDDETFWRCAEEVYCENKLTREPPKLSGIDSKMFLLTLKWMWIQEDFNYKLGWQEVESPEAYVLETKRGARIKKGAGKAKFFAALVLLRSKYFTFEEVEKIISMFA